MARLAARVGLLHLAERNLRLHGCFLSAPGWFPRERYMLPSAVCTADEGSYACVIRCWTSPRSCHTRWRALAHASDFPGTAHGNMHTGDIYAVAIGKPPWYAATTWRCRSTRPGWRGGPREALRARRDGWGRRRHVVHPSSHIPQGHSCQLSNPSVEDKALKEGP